MSKIGSNVLRFKTLPSKIPGEINVPKDWTIHIEDISEKPGEPFRHIRWTIYKGKRGIVRSDRWYFPTLKSYLDYFVGGDKRNYKEQYSREAVEEKMEKEAKRSLVSILTQIKKQGKRPEGGYKIVYGRYSPPIYI